MKLRRGEKGMKWRRKENEMERRDEIKERRE